MKLIGNVNLSLRIIQTVFLVLGLWAPDIVEWRKYVFYFYSFLCLNFILGIYIIVQIGDLIQVWGDLPLMTAIIFLLFTNLALGTKVINALLRKKVIQDMLREAHEELSLEERETGRDIVRSCDRETSRQLGVYCCLSYMTVIGWALSAEKNQLPLRAWYPYDTTKTPAYQLTYTHQVVAVFIAAGLNVSLDTLVTSLISQCRCRLRLLALSLRTLSDHLEISETGLLTPSGDMIFSDRLYRCVLRHQAVLTQVNLLQNCFSLPILAQFCVSTIIICVTAYQLAFEATSLIRIISMVAYLTVMCLQVFLYCYQGNQLVEESEGVSDAAYECPWYTCSIPIRKSLLVLMTRTRRAARLTAAGYTELSLASFMSLIKASYTFFTVLQQVERT